MPQPKQFERETVLARATRIKLAYDSLWDMAGNYSENDLIREAIKVVMREIGTDLVQVSEDLLHSLTDQKLRLEQKIADWEYFREHINTM